MSIPALLRRLLEHTRGQGPGLGAAYLCMVILNITTVIYAALLGPALEFVFVGDASALLRRSDGELRPLWDFVPGSWVGSLERAASENSLWLLPGLIVVVAAFKGLAQTGQFFLFGRTSQRALRDIRSRAFSSLLAQPPGFFTDRNQGDLLSRLTSDALDVERAFFYGLGSLLRDTLAVAGLLFFVFYSDPVLALVTFVTVPIAVWPLTRFTRWMRRISRRSQEAQGKITTTLHESLAGVGVVQAFGNEALERARLDRQAGAYYRELLRSYFVRAVRTPTMEVIGALALAGLFYLLARYVRSGTGDAAHYVSFLGAVFLMYDPLKKLGKVSDYLAVGAAAAERIYELIDLPPTIVDAPDARDFEPRHASGVEVELDQVTFEYEGSEEDQSPGPVLREVSLRVEAGQCLAIVGPSGAGKTTLANLLPRFYDLGPDQGSIRIDGIDIRSLRVASLRRHMAVVGQDTFLFNASVAENIGYGDPAADRGPIETAARAAHADGFIRALPRGYDTVVGERGLRLSGGQRQRIALARAFLKDAPLLILDEATSNLDVESEREIQTALGELMKDRTTVVIAHRLTTIRQADVICVLKDGVIVERGTHDELEQMGAEYSRLHELSSLGDTGSSSSSKSRLARNVRG